MTAEEETMTEFTNCTGHVISGGAMVHSGPCPIHPEAAIQAKIARLAAELGRVQEAYDRAKPVLDAARAWAAVERQSGVSRVGTALVNTNLSLDRRAVRARMLAAVDAYDTAQKAPDPLADPCPHCGPGYRYGDDGCRHEPAEVDHPDADNAETPAWLEEAAKAAFRAVWEYGDGKVLALDRDDWRIAIRAAAPIIAALTLASVSRPIEPRGRLAPEDYEDVAALRARLADAERERDRYQKGAEDCAAHLAEATAALTELAPSSLLAENVALRAQLAAARRATLNEAADALLKHRIDLHDGWAGYRNSVRDGRLGGLEEAATLLRERAKEDLQ